MATSRNDTPVRNRHQEKFDLKTKDKCTQQRTESRKGPQRVAVTGAFGRISLPPLLRAGRPFGVAPCMLALVVPDSPDLPDVDRERPFAPEA